LALNGNNKRVAIISQDSFYKDLITVEDLAKATSGDYNFDHPDAIDVKLFPLN
jgi:uridine kinase